ncbi:MAG TPA: hypothetical protein VK513_06280 [Terriglobales bacterium]|nr:hypothetical protein [Terriglobales bacterium]
MSGAGTAGQDEKLAIAGANPVTPDPAAKDAAPAAREDADVIYLLHGSATLYHR